MKPLGKIKLDWNRDFSYAIGLLTTDVCLYKDGRHLSLTTKDYEQAQNFKTCLKLAVKIGTKKSSYNKNSTYYHVQFGDKNFYNFLLNIGLSPAKTKRLGVVNIPDKYIFDFLRGHSDGDGSFYSYFDPRWKSSFMFYTIFMSASYDHLKWIRDLLTRLLHIKGYLSKKPQKSTYQLRYAKGESLMLLKKIYQNKSAPCLSRKRLKISKALSIVNRTI